MPEHAFSIRTAVSDDFDSMFECYCHTMRHHVEIAWGWDETFQRDGFLRSMTLSTSKVIEVQGCFAGFIWLQEMPQEAVLRLICIEPAYQGSGIGTYLIKAATDRHPALRIKVFNSNRAIEFYRRLGFREVSADEHMREMIYDSEKAHD